jgi:PEGA domain
MRRRNVASWVMVIAAALWVGATASVLRAEQRRKPDGQTEKRPQEGEGKAVPRGDAPRRPDTSPEQGRAVPRDEVRRPSSGPPPQAGRRVPPARTVPGRYHALPRAYAFPPIDVRLGYYYHPFFGFYYGPYYGPFYPYPGPFVRHTRYSVSAIRVRVRPDTTQVYVNGYYAGIVDDFNGAFQRLYVPAGEHHLEFRLDGYVNIQQHVYVGPGDTLEITHTMRPLRLGETTTAVPRPRALPPEWTGPEPGGQSGGEEDQPASPYGILALLPDPIDAQIYVDGEAWDAVDDQKELVLHLPSGWHAIEVRKAGYRTFSTRVELTEGQTTRLNVKLEP